MRNFKVAPWGYSTFQYLGGEAWPKAMPNEELPYIFSGVRPKPFEQELEEMEREARNS